MIVYSNFLMPKWADGRTLGPIIQIRPSKKDDKDLLVHEKVHQQQWRRNPVLFYFRYLFSKKWRLRYELEAYREQLKLSPQDLDEFAYLLSTKYNLDITKQRAKDLLQKL